VDTQRFLAATYAAVAPHLNERQRRLLGAAAARTLGRGGITQVARATGLSRPTIRAGGQELAQPETPQSRVRRVGGGRKALRETDPTLVAALEALVDPDTRGDPMSPLRWTCKSTAQLASALTAAGHPVSHDVVADLLRALDYSLQAPVKTREGQQHPDRDAQFRYLNEQVRDFRARDLPVLSVDAKKKELVGRFKNGGREWQPVGQPEAVNVHDFPDPLLGKAIPYGIYDVGRNTGWVSVGTDHDTASFAVESLRRWWRGEGAALYSQARHLLVCADGGGSNGYRVRLWKYELGRWATETGLTLTICHLPPGTSKWNKIEHRLFAHISLNWRGRSLESHEVIVNLIGATTTRQGLQVHAELDPGRYPTHRKVSDELLATVHLTRHDFHAEWNYTILPDTPLATH
jgi:Rhodopirellula transposase DDE domain